MSERFRCRDCGEAIQARAQLCVACFRKRHKPCPYCMYWNGSVWKVKKVRGKKLQPVYCRQCNNERWILAEGEA